MSGRTPSRADWRERAACAGGDTGLWFSASPGAAQEICQGCSARAECLHDALEHETPYTRYGIWGGLTVSQRRGLTIPAGPKPDAIATLRELLAAEDDATPERTDQPMSQPTPQLEPTVDLPLKPAPEALPFGQLLKWGDQHTDPDIRDQAARGRAILAALRTRHAADQELTSITTEAEQLQKRLDELRAREAELAPKAKRKRGAYVRDYDAREVRAWAGANGIECPRVGQLPKRVLDAWRAATGSTS